MLPPKSYNVSARGIRWYCRWHTMILPIAYNDFGDRVVCFWRWHTAVFSSWPRHCKTCRDISQESIGGAGFTYNIFDISVLSCPPMDYICKDFHADGIRAGWVGSDILRKAFTKRFVLDTLKSRKFHSTVRTWQCVTLMGCFIYISATSHGINRVPCVVVGVHIKLSAWVLRCSFYCAGQCESLKVWDVRQVRISTLFCVCLHHPNLFQPTPKLGGR